MAKILEHVIVKLLGIVNGDFSWDTKATDDVLPEKLFDCCRVYVSDWLCLNPLCKILNCYNSEGVVAFRQS
jgi:hypothetical protein